jgi:hypothetical protein
MEDHPLTLSLHAEEAEKAGISPVEPPEWFRRWVDHAYGCTACLEVASRLPWLGYLQRQAAQVAREARDREFLNGGLGNWRRRRSVDAVARRAYLAVMAMAPVTPLACSAGLRLMSVGDLDLAVGIHDMDRDDDKAMVERIMAVARGK